MMRLSLMKRVVDTVDEEWRSPLAFELMENWGYDVGEVYYWRASANFIFVCKRDGKTYFLRFNDGNERTIEEIESELNVIQYLAEHSIRVAQPVKSKNDRYIETVQTELGTFHAVLFEEAVGEHLEFEELIEEQFFLWGSSLGELHEVLKKAPVVLQDGRSSWSDHLDFAERSLPQKDQATRNEIHFLREWAKNLEKTEDNFGLIHYDFELDNLKVKDHQISILDFDDCASYWYVADIVYALRDAGEFDVHSPNIQKFMGGYRERTQLDDKLMEEAEGFSRMHRLLMYAKLIRTVDIEESADHPEWLTNLREKLVRKIEEYRQSLEVLQS
ncbi:phosphotransferase enzyme family protein [Chungangia koreensis]|uniref:Phosphotransferase enzyme family protein n=1 Tax=Chungangia koreensis TaxID=752657 RepID=A0ABV8X119_9LACT